jgi:opacity protein-like surface antigen
MTKFLCLTSLLLTPLALAADHPPAFEAGTWTLQSYATYAGGLGEYANISAGHIGGSYYVFNNLSLGLELSGGFVHQSDFGAKDAWLYGASAILRHHVLELDRRTTIFIDASFGPFEASHRLPAGGTHFNFITRVGLGATYQLKDNLYLIAGARYFHLSNARIEGSDRNPSINGVEGVLGLMWRL